MEQPTQQTTTSPMTTRLVLTALGYLPFLFCLVAWIAASLMTIRDALVPIGQNIVAIEFIIIAAFVSYSLAILGFINGSIWGQNLMDTDSTHRLSVQTNLYTALPWLLLPTGFIDAGIPIILLGLFYLIVYKTEYTNKSNKNTDSNITSAINADKAYRNMRRRITLLVTTTHFIFGVLLILF